MKKNIAILGYGSTCPDELLYLAREVGKQLAIRGFTVFAGGVGGVFKAAFESAKSAGGLTVAVISNKDTKTESPSQVVVKVACDANKWSAIVESCEGAIVIGGGLGTMNLVSQFLTQDKPVVALNNSGGIASNYSNKALIQPNIGLVKGAETVEDAISQLIEVLS
jgi:hypothetical protein